MFWNKPISCRLSTFSDYPSLEFESFSHIRQVLKILGTKYSLKGNWRNYFLFYLPLFDDFYKVYEINGVTFIVEPAGFTTEDGYAIWTEIENTEFFKVICEIIEQELKLKISGS